MSPTEEEKAMVFAAFEKSSTKLSWSLRRLVSGKPWGRSQSSYPEQTCATTRATAAPWRTPWRAISQAWFGMSCKQTTSMAPLALIDVQHSLQPFEDFLVVPTRLINSKEEQLEFCQIRIVKIELPWRDLTYDSSLSLSRPHLDSVGPILWDGESVLHHI